MVTASTFDSTSRHRSLPCPVAGLSVAVLCAMLTACAPDAVQLGKSMAPGAADAGRPGDATCHPNAPGSAGAKDEATCTPSCGAHAHCVAPGKCRCDAYFVFDGQGCVCAPNTVALTVNGELVCAPDYPAWGIGPLAPTGFVDHCDGTVTHELTGLTWQVDSTIAGPMSWEGALKYCDALELGGRADWRLPTVAELVSSISFTGEPWPGEGSPFIWDGDLSLRQGGEYHAASLWTVKPLFSTKKYEPRPWVVIDDAQFGATAVGDPVDLGLTAARCVRGDARSRMATQRFAVDKHTVLDTATGRRWQRSVGTDELTETHAEAYCGANHPGLPGGGWRLPNVRELMSLIDRDRKYPAIDTDAFPEQLPYSSTFAAGQPRWSTPKCGDCRYMINWSSGIVMAWSIHDDPRGPTFPDKVDDPHHVRCVRVEPTE